MSEKIMLAKELVEKISQALKEYRSLEGQDLSCLQTAIQLILDSNQTYRGLLTDAGVAHANIHTTTDEGFEDWVRCLKLEYKL